MLSPVFLLAAKGPTKSPTKGPTTAPTIASPTKAPTAAATTKAPVTAATKTPVAAATKKPIAAATKAPTATATTKAPVAMATKKPVTAATKQPVAGVTKAPTKAPTTAPTRGPTSEPLQKLKEGEYDNVVVYDAEQGCHVTYTAAAFKKEYPNFQTTDMKLNSWGTQYPSAANVITRPFLSPSRSRVLHDPSPVIEHEPFRCGQMSPSRRQWHLATPKQGGQLVPTETNLQQYEWWPEVNKSAPRRARPRQRNLPDGVYRLLDTMTALSAERLARQHFVLRPWVT